MTQEEIRRALRFLNQAELAKETGLSVVTISRIATGKGKANESTLKALSNVIQSLTKRENNEREQIPSS